jgi:hypothetical protein
MKYQFIEEQGEAYKIKSMCEVLRVSRTGVVIMLGRDVSRA